MEYDHLVIYLVYIDPECVAGVNYVINGVGCNAWGDPHFTMFNGATHHFQGQDNKQYYYVHPCFAQVLKHLLKRRPMFQAKSKSRKAFQEAKNLQKLANLLSIV